MNIRCFLLEPTELGRYSLRRYAHNDRPDSRCPGPRTYHDAAAAIGDSPCTLETPGRADPRWPSRCSCGYQFADGDEWQLFHESVYRRSDTGELLTLRAAPPGAMWTMPWYKVDGSEPPRYGCWWDNQFEPPLVVMTPGGEWVVDSRASNCTLPGDKLHRCWPRTGQLPVVTVAKVGNTCSAGAGSIMVGNYHGFLRNGELVSC